MAAKKKNPMNTRSPNSVSCKVHVYLASILSTKTNRLALPSTIGQSQSQTVPEVPDLHAKGARELVYHQGRLIQCASPL
eukprot:1154875-Pelagomonas_calceolata.AAC.1